jgi:hypothetical protein
MAVLNQPLVTIPQQTQEILTYHDSTYGKNILTVYNNKNLEQRILLQIDQDKILYNQNNVLKEVSNDKDLIKAFSIVVCDLAGFGHKQFMRNYDKEVIKNFLNKLSVKNRRLLKLNCILK